MEKRWMVSNTLQTVISPTFSYPLSYACLNPGCVLKRRRGDGVRYIGSTNGLNKLGSLKPEDLQKVREAFKKNVHPRFMKEFFYHKPYGKARLFKEKVDQGRF